MTLDFKVSNRFDAGSISKTEEVAVWPWFLILDLDTNKHNISQNILNTQPSKNTLQKIKFYHAGCGDKVFWQNYAIVPWKVSKIRIKLQAEYEK